MTTMTTMLVVIVVFLVERWLTRVPVLARWCQAHLP